MTPIQRARAARRFSLPQSVSAPIKGWNTRDPFEAMDPLDAILLDNWIPDFGGAVVRGGSKTFVSGLGSAPVQTLAPFQTASNKQFLVACAGTISEIASGVATTVSSGFHSDIWATAVFQGHQFWVNGVDPAQHYDGKKLAVSEFTGAAMTSMEGVGVFNNRLYFWTGHDPGFWYGPVDGIAGVLNRFDLSTVSQAGGNVIAVEVLSYDGGTGIDDYTCFFMSSGEVLMYSGTDPSNAANWALVGRYLIPRPISGRSIARYGGDIYLTTTSDHQQFSKLLIALRLGQVPPRSKASGAAVAAFAAGASLPGWQALYYPGRTQIIHNIPNPDGSFSQHVYNTATQGWCRLNGWNANCFGFFDDKLYFGSANGKVIQADIGTTDDGAAILAQAQQAWQLFDSPLIKRVAAVRPFVESQGIASFSFGLGFDYQPPVLTIPDSTIQTDDSLVFGTSNWGPPAVWGGAGVSDPRWHIASGSGGAIGMLLQANTSVGATWVRTDLMLESGIAL